jgi:tetratricopeptide (TPR) repeat protein
MRAWWLGLAVFLVAGVAGGHPPDHWERARDPAALARDTVLDEVADQLEEAQAKQSQLIRQEMARTSRAAIEKLGPAAAADPRARFLLGMALHLLDDDSAVIEVLAPAVKAFPDHPLVVRALFDLAVSYAKAERSRDEVEAYDRLLEREIDPGWRSTVLSNRAESRAKLGDAAGAIADYQESIQLASNAVLPRWGLAVMFDRQGDLARALEEGGFAWDLDHHDPSRLDHGGVFFVPSYDRWWYHGLRQLSASRRTENSEEKIQHLERAARFYELYASQAPSFERWVPLARSRVKLCEAQMARLKKLLPKPKKTVTPVNPAKPTRR